MKLVLATIFLIASTAAALIEWSMYLHSVWLAIVIVALILFIGLMIFLRLALAR